MASPSNNKGNLMQGLDSKSRALIDKIVAHLKSHGNFDELRRDCLEELDKMEAFRQLNQRVESYVATFLSKQEWSDSLSKNQMRNSLRKHVCDSDALKTGAQRLVTQVIEKKSRAFQTSLEGIVQNFIYMDKEREKQERQARYYSKYAGSLQESATSKAESSKVSNSEKGSAISDVNDIISQIEQEKVETTSKSEASSSIKPELVPSSQQSSSSTSSKSESTLSKQKTSGAPIYSSQQSSPSTHSKSELTSSKQKASGILSHSSQQSSSSTSSKSESSLSKQKTSGAPSYSSQQSSPSTHSKSELTSSKQKTSGILSNSSQQSSPSTSLKSESTMSRQRTSGIPSKFEQAKHEKKAESPSSYESPPSKNNLLKKSNQSKKAVPKINTSQNPSSPSEKTTEILAQSKPSKPNPLPITECLPEQSEEAADKETLKMDLDSLSANSEVTKTLDGTSATSQDGLMVKSSEQCSRVVEKHEENDNIITDVKKEEKKGVSMQSEEKNLILKNEAKTEIKEYKVKLDSIKLEQKKEEREDLEGEPTACSDNSRNNSGILEESDSDESVSDVSSVHTSDLSSFDGEVSSVSEVSDDDNVEGGEHENTGNSMKVKNSSRQKASSSKKTESESDQASEERSHRGPRRTAEALPKRKRGRPRKEEYKTREAHEHKSKAEGSRSNLEDHKTAIDGVHVRDKSKRTIKKKRCYSPSSEGTREVCLPLKRSRVNSRD